MINVYNTLAVPWVELTWKSIRQTDTDWSSQQLTQLQDVQPDRDVKLDQHRCLVDDRWPVNVDRWTPWTFIKTQIGTRCLALLPQGSGHFPHSAPCLAFPGSPRESGTDERYTAINISRIFNKCTWPAATAATGQFPGSFWAVSMYLVRDRNRQRQCHSYKSRGQETDELPTVGLGNMGGV